MANRTTFPTGTDAQRKARTALTAAGQRRVSCVTAHRRDSSNLSLHHCLIGRGASSAGVRRLVSLNNVSIGTMDVKSDLIGVGSVRGTIRGGSRLQTHSQPIGH
eukprot:CAMPEP_0173073464 /NCGR_PEP_ID=MMETSP1102-20130122/10426_1 /TAXON_ID=49646 /ORGANISM="Geminigera sp., Strain Caron Lab Isolate" /LENGTH=103 /DNA_ID=CAMNT_0013942325 /DNA_START=42 /DNA_END=353 /DNA_ORIENTATION=+